MGLRVLRFKVATRQKIIHGHTPGGVGMPPSDRLRWGKFGEGERRGERVHADICEH